VEDSPLSVLDQPAARLRISSPRLGGKSRTVLVAKTGSDLELCGAASSALSGTGVRMIERAEKRPGCRPGCAEGSSSKAARSTTTEAYPLGTSQGGVQPRAPLAAFLGSLGSPALFMSASAAIADSLVRRAFGRRARPSDPQRTARVRLRSSRLRTPVSRRDSSISRRTVMNNAG